jgi:hypothetical protein
MITPFVGLGIMGLQTICEARCDQETVACGGGVGVDGLDVEGLEGAAELRQLTVVLWMIDVEDAVPVGVERDRPAMPIQVLAQ